MPMHTHTHTRHLQRVLTKQTMAGGTAGDSCSAVTKAVVDAPVVRRCTRRQAQRQGIPGVAAALHPSAASSGEQAREL